MVARRLLALLALFAISFSVLGCGDDSSSSSGSSETSSNSSTMGKGDPGAVKFVQGEIEKRYLNAPDGLVTAQPWKIRPLQGNKRAGPENIYIQYKALKFEVEEQKITDSDKLNGVEFVGRVEFEDGPMRRAEPSESDFNRIPYWSEWRTGYESFLIQKKKGEWRVVSNTFFLDGEKPTQEQYVSIKSMK